MTKSLVLAVLIGAIGALSVACSGGTLRNNTTGSSTTTADAGNTVTDAGTGNDPVDTTPDESTISCGAGTHLVMEGNLGTCVIDTPATPDPDPTSTEKTFCADRDDDGKLDCNTCRPGTTAEAPYKEKTSASVCDDNDEPSSTPIDAGTPTDAGTGPSQVECGTGTILVGNICEVAPPPATDAGSDTTVDAGTPEVPADAGTAETPDAGSDTTVDAGPSTTTCPAGQHLSNGACVNDAPPATGSCTFTVNVPSTYDNLRVSFNLDASGQVSGWDCYTTGSSLTCTAPIGKVIYVQANLTAGNHWLCDGFTDAGDSAAHLTAPVTITGCGYTNVTPYHKPNAISSDGCAGRVIPSTP